MSSSGRFAKFCVVVSLLCFSFAALAAAQETPLPRVVILTTGGTIASSATGAPMSDGRALVQAVPQLLNHARIDVEEFNRVGSSAMTPAQWLGLAKRTNELFAKQPDLSGVVITHGTDTLEEAAFFLNLTVRSEKPVVVVGSMRAADEISPDGPGNLVNAVRVAASPAAVGQGVLVVLNEDIGSARDVWKTQNRRVNTFQSSSAGFLGSVEPDGIRFTQKSLRTHTARSEFDVSQLQQLPRVLILSDFSGIDADVVTNFLAQQMDGLVVRTFAGGRMSPGMREGLRKSVGRNVPIVVTSRVPGGRIVGRPEYDFPATVARDLPDNKARLLLMLALTRTKDPAELQRMFDTY